MEQIIFTEEMIKKLLKKRKVELISTHKKLSLPIINRIYGKMMLGIQFDEIKVFENLIIDGHHRYISSILAEKNIGRIRSQKTSATTETDWNEVEFVQEEWDTESKIRRLNELDAEYNKITLEKLLELTKKR